MDTIYVSPVCELKELKDIFIELTAKNCNMRCRQCYINFPFSKNIKDFIKLDNIKQCLEQLNGENIRCIYLTGAEPMTHPDFNTILRLCIKKANVCICTNGSFINEKKARFLKSVESSSDKKIMFRLSFAHWEELKNDAVRSRGAYRQSFYALKCLDKYDFINIISVSNYYCENHENIVEQFTTKLSEYDIENAVVQINEWVFDKNDIAADNIIKELTVETDCMTSRTLTANGVFSCPFLANDYRGRVGSDFHNYSKSIRLETVFCEACLKNKEKMFSFDLDYDISQQ